MKKKHNEGFSLIEVMLAIVILAAIVVPTCTSLVLSYRMNAKTEQLMKAQLAVSSAVEQLMSEGITVTFVESLSAADETDSDSVKVSDDYPGILFVIEQKEEFYIVTVTDENELVTVTTQIRAAGGNG